MKILFISGREFDYTRNQVILRALSRIGEVETVTINESLNSLALRSLQVSIKAFPKYISNKYDVIFVGFYGHLLMLPVGWFHRSPVVFDAFISTFDTLTSDRQTYSAKSITGRLAALLDRYACFLADIILVDTSAHVDYFCSVLSVKREKLFSLPVSCNEDIFFPRTVNRQMNGITEVLSYSTYLPIHGVETIVKAAAILKGEALHFRMIGKGPLYDPAYLSSTEFGLDNITFTPPISLQQLSDEIANADICLGGPFGLSPKAKRVIPGKIYQMMAMRKPLIASDSPAIKELLRHGSSAYLCPPGDPSALANAIMELHRNPELRSTLASGGYETYQKYCSETVVTDQLKDILSK